MSKKRLEGIKKRLVLLHNAIDVDDETKNYIFKDLKVEWLIEQAERVQELETRIDNFYKLNMKLYKQNKRYREALEYLLSEVNEMDEPHEALTDFLVQALEEGMTIN